MLCRLPIETNRNRENSFIYIYTETFSIVLMKPCFLPFALGVSCWVFGDVVFVAKTSSHLRFNKNSLKKNKKKHLMLHISTYSFLELQTTSSLWLFQLDDSKSLHGKLLFN